MSGTERPPPSLEALGVGKDIGTHPTQLPASLRGSLSDLPLVCPTCGVLYPAEFRVCPRDAAELVDARSSGPPDALVGQTLAGTYAVTRVVGEGGMGRVYEARHLRVGGKRFAIKALHAEFSRNQEVLQRFQREAEAAASIRSPYVVEVYDVLRTDDGRPFMVAEFLSGRELADHIMDVGRMDVPEAIRLVRQICDGLSKAHALGIVHRDMKPENVFLIGDPKLPQVKILDFGISKSGDKPGTQLTKTGVIMGTPSFMAPEQARGEKVDHLADVYAVGAILYMMLTGRRPFDKGDPTATLTALLLEDPPRPRSLDPSIPEGLEAIIQRAMAKQPSERHPTLEALSRDLAAFEHPGGLARAPEPHRAGAHAVGTRSRAFATRSLLVGSARSRARRRRPHDPPRGGDSRSRRRHPCDALGGPNSRGAVGRELGSSDVDGARHRPCARSPRRRGRAHRRARSFTPTAPPLAGLAVFGFGTLIVRFLEVLVVRRAIGAAWPVWEILLSAAALVAAGLAFLVTRLDARK